MQFESKIEKASEVIIEGLEADNKLTYLVRNAMQKDTSFFKVSVDSLQNVAHFFLEDFIADQLNDQGIESDFKYALKSSDNTYCLSSEYKFEDNGDVESFPFRLEGYFTEQLGTPVILELQFNNLHNYFLGKLNGLTLPSVLFLIGICATVIWVLRTYYWQSKIITVTNEFINNLTHELKTPVFSIGLASKILNESANEKQRPVLSLIRQQVDRLSTHIDKVLELATLESGKSVMQLKSVDFKPHLEQLCANFQTLVAIENANFTYRLKNSKYPLKAEVFHLENAINNILDNAKKYSEKPIIELYAGLERFKLIIEIKDNGRGLSRRQQKNVFKKYYRVTNGNIHNVKGHGLGLSYVKKVINKHRGKVVLESTEGKGTKIKLILPIDKQ